MKSPPKFIISGKSDTDAFLYMGLGLSFIVLFIFIIVEHPIEWNLKNILIVSGIACLIMGCAYLSFHVASIASTNKRIIFDGLFLYIYYGDTLKYKVNFKNVKQIGNSAYIIKGFPVYYVYIKYSYKGKRKTLRFYEDDYTKQGLKNIFWKLVGCAEYYNVKIEDPKYWMKDILLGKRSL